MINTWSCDIRHYDNNMTMTKLSYGHLTTDCTIANILMWTHLDLMFTVSIVTWLGLEHSEHIRPKCCNPCESFSRLLISPWEDREPCFTFNCQSFYTSATSHLSAWCLVLEQIKNSHSPPPFPPQFFNKELGASHRNYSSPIWCL